MHMLVSFVVFSMQCFFLFVVYCAYVCVEHEIPLQRVQCVRGLAFDCDVSIKWLVSREIDTFEMKSLAYTKLLLVVVVLAMVPHGYCYF